MFGFKQTIKKIKNLIKLHIVDLVKDKNVLKEITRTKLGIKKFKKSLMKIVNEEIFK